jgi:hypothetical protein
MGKRPGVLLRTLLFAALFGIILAKDQTVTANGPTRQTTIVVPYTRYEWWLISWENNDIFCRIFVDHEGLPTPGEVETNCGAELARVWVKTPVCKNPNSANGCQGVYVHLVSVQLAEKEVVVELPPPTVMVRLQGCNPIPPENFCPVIPSLLFIGDEPLPNEQIISIEGLYAGMSFKCAGSECLLPLTPTPLQGYIVEFWANSSYGDTSDRYTALVRVLDTGVSTSPGTSGWYVDVISSQWVGEPIASCARIWEAFPPAGPQPTWLTSPVDSDLIASDYAYFYLAGRLIAQGVVDASQCSTGGLLPNGYADSCGIEKARTLLTVWQNQFDQSIVDASQKTGVPAQLLKNLFAQESQFWPGVFRVPFEFGLGQITAKGTDSIFLWNPEFYTQFCPSVLSEETCQTGYLYLKDEEQLMLRGALAAQAWVDCPGCTANIDLAKTQFSVELFAQTLVANCAQVGQTINTATNLKAGQVADYEDLWRFTVANYHAGPGCLAYAIHIGWLNSVIPLTWEGVSNFFTPACQGVVPYVNQISLFQNNE